MLGIIIFKCIKLKIVCSIKDEFKLSHAKLHKYKIKYRNLIMENRTIEEMILSCYTRMNDLKDRKIF